MFDHWAEHLGRCRSEGLASNQKLELDAKGCDALLKPNCVELLRAPRKRLGSRVLAETLA